MVASISSANAARVSAQLFAKLDTRNKGYVDQADLEQAAPAGKSDSAAAAQLIKQIDGDGNGQVSKSELSEAVQKVGAELDAQFDQSRLQFAGAPAEGGARPAAPPAGGGGAGGGGGGGGLRAAGGADAASESGSSGTEIKYNASADTDSDGTVSADEEAAFKKLQARVEERAREQIKLYSQNDGDSVPGQARTLDVSA